MSHRVVGYVLEIEWDVPNLPRLVGVFGTRDAANSWATTNIPNGSWSVSPVASAYRIEEQS